MKSSPRPVARSVRPLAFCLASGRAQERESMHDACVVRRPVTPIASLRCSQVRKYLFSRDRLRPARIEVAESPCDLFGPRTLDLGRVGVLVLVEADDELAHEDVALLVRELESALQEIAGRFGHKDDVYPSARCGIDRALSGSSSDRALPCATARIHSCSATRRNPQEREFKGHGSGSKPIPPPRSRLRSGGSPSSRASRSASRGSRGSPTSSAASPRSSRSPSTTRPSPSCRGR